MTTEIEKELFERYGVKSKLHIYTDFPCAGYCTHEPSYCHGCSKGNGVTVSKEIYPPITAEKVLRLIEFALSAGGDLEKMGELYRFSIYNDMFSDDILKNCIIKSIIELHNIFTLRECKEIREMLEG